MSADGAEFAAARALFEAVDEAGAEEREALLAGAPPAVASRVRGWLAAEAAAGDFLERPAAEGAEALVVEWLGESESDEPASAPPSRVGPYRLLRLLGRGGMGEVWEATRDDGQFERTVAVKLVQRGPESAELARRFARERRILARLVHPGIARLYDGGFADDGRPYLVLEKVDGEPITVWARERELPLAGRLRLVLAVAEAVESAHAQLVVHRDLKPSNVLVTDAGEVKLLDFGIAKLLDDAEGGDERDRTALTALGGPRLTPAYAAPEQILGGPVTTATDVYSLGVVLCELLTGRLPHERPTGSSVALAASLERETTPRLPALVEAIDEERLRRLGLPERERRGLGRRLAGDLETLVARALAREPERRYPSMAALADDLRRALDGRPLLARRDSRLYRARKFVVRHRVGVGAAALVALAIVGGLTAALWQARRAALAAEAAAASARSAVRTRDFLVSLFEVADPMKSGGETVTARQLLDQGAKRLETELAGEPVLRADLLEAVARIETSLGLVADAESTLATSLALRAPDDVGARAREAAMRGALGLQKGDLDGAEKSLAEAVAGLERSGAPPLEIARARGDLGEVAFWRKRSAESLAIETEVERTFARELGEEHVETAIHRRNLGILYDDLGRYDEAEAAFRSSQAVLEQSLGGEHPHLAQSYVSLAVLLDRRGRTEEADELFRRALAIRRRAMGDHHQQTGQTLQLLADFLVRHGRLDEAEAAAREALALFRALDPKHFEVGKCLNQLGVVFGNRREWRQAETFYREAIDNFRTSLGPDHPFTWWTHGNLGRVISEQGRHAEAEAVLRETLAALERVSGTESDDARWVHELLAGAFDRAGRKRDAEAERARERAIAAKLAG